MPSEPRSVEPVNIFVLFGIAVEHRMVRGVKLHLALANAVEPLSLGVDQGSWATSVVQEAGVPLRPSISTRQGRQQQPTRPVCLDGTLLKSGSSGPRKLEHTVTDAAMAQPKPRWNEDAGIPLIQLSPMTMPR